MGEMPLSFYDSIMNGDLRVDWPMVLVGWQGFGQRKLSVEQVIALAQEQIGRGALEQDNLAALLVNTDHGNWQTVDRYLQQVAESMQYDRNLALRKWRLAELKSFMQDILPLDGGEDEEEPYSIFFALVDFWQGYAELSDSLTMTPYWGVPTKELISQHQEWIEKEEQLLKTPVANDLWHP